LIEKNPTTNLRLAISLTFSFAGVRKKMITRLAVALCCVVVIVTFPSLANSQTGIASVYGGSGERTASGERLSLGSLTAAHRSLPFGSYARVTNKHNGRSVVVRINDRGPYVRGRVIDLTVSAARVLGFSGLAQVEVTPLRGNLASR